MLAETATTGTDGWVLIALAITTTVGVVVSAYFGYKASIHAKDGAEQARIGAQQSTQTNDAVNHHHESGQDRLFDIVVDTRDKVKAIDEWKERWDGLPEQLSSADALTTHFAVIEDRIVTTADSVHNRISQLDKENSAQHQSIVKMLQDHIDDEAPKIASLADSIAAMETRAEAGDRTDSAVEHIETDAQEREDRT